jgi:hypothetical protein
MPGLSGKIFNFTSGRYFLSPSLHCWLANCISCGGIFKSVDIIVKYPDVWHILKIGYIVSSILGIAITADLIYKNILAKIFPKHSKADEFMEIRPPPYP